MSVGLLGQFRILEIIGAGSMDVASRAHDQELDRETAPKVHPFKIRADETGCAGESGDRYRQTNEVRSAREALGARELMPSTFWRKTSARRRCEGPAAVAAVLLLIAGLYSGCSRTQTLMEPLRVKSLAVLPLENLSGDAEQDYWADGIQEGLIASLGRIQGLQRVVNRNSVSRRAKADKALLEIGRDLGVDAIITGTVLRSGNRVRLAAHLIKVSTGEQLWKKDCEGELRDILSMQNEMVLAIVQSIGLQLPPRDRARLAHARQVNPEGYEAYLKGKYYFNQRTPEGYKRGVALFRQAIEKDPFDPLPYADWAFGIAVIAHGDSAIIPTQEYPSAEEAALKAIELDEAYPEAHTALAVLRTYFDFDLPGADREYQRAMELNPNLADAHEHYGWYLLLFGRDEEALAEVKRAQDLEPIAPLYIAYTAWMYLAMGQNDLAIEAAQKALALDPKCTRGLYVLGSAYGGKNMMEQAIATHQKLVQVNPNWKHSLAVTYLQAGRKTDALRLVAEMEREDYPRYSAHLSGIHTMLGNKEKAIRALQDAYEFRHGLLPWLVCFPEDFPWASDPRYQELRRRLNFR